MLTAIIIAAVAPGLIDNVRLWACIIIAVCAIIGIALVVIRQTGVAIPAWLITILWIILAAVIGIAAINLLVSMI